VHTYDSFNCAVNTSDRNYGVNSSPAGERVIEKKVCGSERLWNNRKCYPGICLARRRGSILLKDSVIFRDYVVSMVDE
jgi:hypothetical protein